MKNKFNIYHKEARLASKKEFKNTDNLIKYYAYFVPTLIFRFVLFIFYPIFRVEDHRVGRQVRNNEDINLGKVFSLGDDTKKLWMSLRLGMLIFLTILGKIIVIGVPSAGLYLLFDQYSYILKDSTLLTDYIKYTPLVIGGLILVIDLIKYLISCIATPYLIEATDETKASLIVEKSKELAKRGGMGRILGNCLLTFLQLVLLTGLLGGIFYVIYQVAYVFTDEIYYAIIYVSLAIVILIFLRLFPVVLLTGRITNELILEDVYISNTKYDNYVIKKEIRKAYSNKIDKNDIKSNMLALFDEQVELEKYNPLKEEEPKEIEVLKKDESTKDFFDDSRITNETSETDTVKYQKNSFQEVIDTSDSKVKVDQDTLNSIDDLLKTKVEEKKEEPKVEETPVQEKKEEPKVEEPSHQEKVEEVKAEEAPHQDKVEAPEVKEEAKDEPLKEEKPKRRVTKKAESAPEEKVKEEKVEAPKKRSTKKAESATEVKVEEPKAEEPKAEEAKVEEQTTKEEKTEEPKKKTRKTTKKESE